MTEETPLTPIIDVGPQSRNQVFKDLFAGTMGGVAQVLTGQPFDCIKVRLQSSPPGTYDGVLDAVRKLVKNEGFGGFYKGTLAPLVGVGACVSVQFGVNEYMKRIFGGTQLSLPEFFVCGAAAGFANGFLASPIEHLRIRLQTNKVPSTPLKTFNEIYNAAGTRGLFKGLGTTLIREAGGMGIYFSVFELLVNRDMIDHKITRNEIPGLRLCIYGGLAGYALWFLIYPIDVFKSILQTDNLKNPKFKTGLSVAKHVYQQYGIKGFYRGFVPTIMRAAPANAVTFYVFELTMRLIN